MTNPKWWINFYFFKILTFPVPSAKSKVKKKVPLDNFYRDSFQIKCRRYKVYADE